MNSIQLASIEDVEAAAKILKQHMSPAPLIRSYELEKALGLPEHRRVWIKDYGWTPVGSFKLMGALNWMAHHVESIGDRPVTAHSSGNFASGLAFAGKAFGKRVIIVMPDTAPKIKFSRTKSLGAEVRTFNLAEDHKTGERDRLTAEITEKECAVRASPYDDNDVISGNGVGGIEIADELQRQGRKLSHLLCPVSGGGLLAGHAIAIANRFPEAEIVGVEPTGANDFEQSLAKGHRVRLDKPASICDGLLSYDVGNRNWPILQKYVQRAISVSDDQTRAAMRWYYIKHGVRTEPSGAITIAGLLDDSQRYDGDGDIVLVLSGRNIDEDKFADWTQSD